MTPTDSELLIVAVSGRALAQSAHRGGYRVRVLDLFTDEDTRAVSPDAQTVVAARALRFDRRRLLAAAATLPAAPLVYGSGFEGRVPLLTRLALGRTLYGNPPDVIARLRDPIAFFALLDRLGLPYPETTGTTPASLDGWLVKQGGGAGGTHVRPAAAARRPARSYYQRLSDGVPMSVLFLANGERARVIGFNEQWTAPYPGLPFLYGGAVSRVDLPESVRNGVTVAVEKLTAETGIRGLNGLDFLLQGDRWQILELNPRPTATMELYDADFPSGLFHAHLHASHGTLPGTMPDGPSRAAMIVHAPHDWVVPVDFHFPAWCSDIPAGGTAIRAGQPICTMHAAADRPTIARALVLERQMHFDRTTTPR